jgi:hypothetical protein
MLNEEWFRACLTELSLQCNEEEMVEVSERDKE